MKNAAFLPLLTAVLLLTACSKKADETPSSTSDGTITWTYNGQNYTSTVYSGAVVDGTAIGITGAVDKNSTLHLSIEGIDAHGVGTYTLPRISSPGSVSAGTLTVAATSPSKYYNTQNGPNASNGTIVVTKYDKAKQQISGTFSFTAGLVSSNPTPTEFATVANGTFDLHTFR
ncbi:DUF6252 family protein [Hymenobacter ruricola]|uniref:Lipoprotein n=1 Tax=Hymenobacter ruricola TaxID=2791023 RepID=A0ABS0I7V2_9BACT|nr:DUF6252 family protein [Hymenobacter ruricola]MBF9222599.1 hypothetical protein [Hymenobacter ruricola]